MQNLKLSIWILPVSLCFFTAYQAPGFARVGEGKNIDPHGTAGTPSPTPNALEAQILKELGKRTPSVESITAGATAGVITSAIIAESKSKSSQNKSAWILLACTVGVIWLIRLVSKAVSSSAPAAAKKHLKATPGTGLSHESGSINNTNVPLGIELASDLFFQIRVAWTRRDIRSVQTYLTLQMMESILQDIDMLKSANKISKLENVVLTDVCVLKTISNDSCVATTIRFKATLLDYVQDETTSEILEGSATNPVNFEEDWTFLLESKSKQWKLSEIG